LNAACASTTGPNQTVSPTYDEADRLTGSGYAYDAFGRTLAVPAADAGGSQLTSSYYVDDRVRQMTQGSVTQTFNLDPLERVRLQSTTGQPDSKFHYSDDSDNSSWIDLGGANSNWQRFVGGPDGMLAATQAGHGATSDGFTYQLCDLHGDVIGTVNNGGTVTQMFKTDEFGVPSGTVPQDGHGWLGGKERRTQFASGAIAMGQRAYVPQIGRFLQVDPVPGGSANDYDYANQDPLNQLDLAGTRPRKRPRAHSAAGIAACHGSVSDAQLITSGDHSVVHGNETTQCLFGGSGRITRLRVNVCIEYYNQYGVPQTLKCKKASRSINPVDGKPYVRSITARCKSGTHKYRLTTDAFFHVEGITGHNGGHGARAVSHETRTFSC
jgi:RHS repeat-associated protein